MVLLESFLSSNLMQFWNFTGFANCQWGNIIMLCVGLFFIYLAIKHDFEPMLLVPIGFGILIGNIPFQPGNEIGIYEEGSVLNILYQGVRQGWYPPLIFLGIGAMTDFSALLANPKLMLVGQPLSLESLALTCWLWLSDSCPTRPAPSPSLVEPMDPRLFSFPEN